MLSSSQTSIKGLSSELTAKRVYPFFYSQRA